MLVKPSGSLITAARTKASTGAAPSSAASGAPATAALPDPEPSLTVVRIGVGCSSHQSRPAPMTAAAPNIHGSGEDRGAVGSAGAE